MMCCSWTRWTDRRFGPMLLALGILALAALVEPWLAARPQEPARPAASPWSGTVPAGQTVTIAEPQASPDALYSVQVAVERPSALAKDDDVLHVTVRDGKQLLLAERLLHEFDGDACILARPTAAGPLTVRCASLAASPAEVRITIRRWETPAATALNIEYEPNNTWQQANPIQLGEVVFATCDDRQLYPARGKANLRLPPPGKLLPPPSHYGQLMTDDEARAVAQGEDWFTFELTGERPKLVFFALDVLDREVPLDVTVWTVQGGRLAPYVAGIDPTSDIAPDTPAIDPHEVQTRLANKFTTRVLKPDRYYVRVEGNHPAYQLRTFAYDPPPYTGPDAARKAVRAGVDYAVNAGDSWHANIPRMGGVQNRVLSLHAETMQCIACHPTHFPMRGQVVAVANGYPVKQRPAVKFLTERLCNNPRPFYGHEGATWGRMISASANVMSRLAYILTLHEHLVTGERRTACLEGVGGYLMLYYKDRTELPPNETNGNTPLVSAYEIAGHAWAVFDELHRRTGRQEYAAYRDLVRQLIERENLSSVPLPRRGGDDVRRPVMLDLCYQTLDFLMIDPKGYEARIKANCERILALQWPDGRWSMLLDPKSAAVQFQTGHCLYVLACAGYKPDHPQVKKGVEYLLRTQQPWGGWFEPNGYENFRTPFRETQFAVMALSQFYPNEDPKRGPEQARGWHAGFPPLPASLDLANESVLIRQLDQIWETPSDKLVAQIGEALAHPEPMVRQAAAEAAGRIADERLLPAVGKLLGDRSKVVRHSAAWALREYATRKRLGFAEVKAALTSPDEMMRRGALRVFNQHFAYLTHDGELGRLLLKGLEDADPQVRMLAARALWQWFWWTDDATLRAALVDALIARMAAERHPHVIRNVREAFYNIADENTRYLFNNWVPLLAQPADREKATRAQHDLMKMIADKVAAALSKDDDALRENLLLALGEFHLRRGGYKNAGRYGRIGNDVEQIQFYPESRSTLEPVFLKLFAHPNPTIREYAAVAAFTLQQKGNPQELPFRWLELYADDSPQVRAVAREFQARYPLPKGPDAEARLRVIIPRLLASTQPEAHAAAFSAISQVGGNLTQDAEILKAVRQAVLAAEGDRLAAALAALPQFPALAADKEVGEAVVKALAANDPAVRKAGLEVALKSPRLAASQSGQFYLTALLRSEAPENRVMLFEIVRANPALADRVEVVSAISEALTAKEEAVRRQALELVQKHAGMQKNPAVRLALQELLKDPNERTRLIAEHLYEGSGKTLNLTDPGKLLDYDYFVQKVQPIFTVKGADGQSCAQCHHTHSIFRLHRPDREGRFTEAQSRANYRSALKVIDLAKPEDSLILRKPLSDASEEGIFDQKVLSHGGGIRWTGPEDPAYRTILDWLHGARLDKQPARREE